MLAEDVLDQNPHSGAYWLAVLPVHGGFSLQPVQQFMGNDAKMVVAHYLNRTLVLGQGVVEGNFLLAESFLFAALVCGADVLGEPNQLETSHVSSGRGWFAK